MTFTSDAKIIIEALDDHFRRAIDGQDPVIRQPPMQDMIAGLDLAALVREGGLSGDRLAEFIQRYLAGVTRVHHPANVAHQQAVPHHAAALAGMVDNFVSSDGSIYEFGPASVSIEYFLINWLLTELGWQPAPIPPQDSTQGPCGGGVFLDGGSLANLTALIAARTRLAPDVWRQGNPTDLVLLVPAETHYSVARAAGIMGLGSAAVMPLAVDKFGCVNPDRLPATHRQMTAEGRRAVALVANAGSTAGGFYDPLAEVGTFCREHGIWLHVDGAHGGPAVLTRKYRHLMKGIELADSLTMNMHKLMRVTSLCTALLVRDAATLDRAFQQEASYLFHDKAQPGYDFHHRTIECTKPVMGLKFFMVLAAMGEAGMSAYIERQFDLTAEAYDYLCSLPDFDCPLPPQCNILCFRVKDAEGGQLALRDRLLARGNYYISTTVLNGERCLRLTLTNPATGLDHIRGLVEEIRRLRRVDDGQL